MKSVVTTYILWMFFGLIGLHRFYLNRFGTGLLYMVTLGIFGIGWLVDIYLIPELVDEANKELYLRVSQVPPPSQITQVVVQPVYASPQGYNQYPPQTPGYYQGNAPPPYK